MGLLLRAGEAGKGRGREKGIGRGRMERGFIRASIRSPYFLADLRP